MTKQVLMFLSTSSLLAVLGVGALHAQTLDHQIQATVPFHFVVGNQTFPPGAYKVTRVDPAQTPQSSRAGPIGRTRDLHFCSSTSPLPYGRGSDAGRLRQGV